MNDIAHPSSSVVWDERSEVLGHHGSLHR